MEVVCFVTDLPEEFFRCQSTLLKFLLELVNFLLKFPVFQPGGWTFSSQVSLSNCYFYLPLFLLYVFQEFIDVQVQFSNGSVQFVMPAFDTVICSHELLTDVPSTHWEVSVQPGVAVVGTQLL